MNSSDEMLMKFFPRTFHLILTRFIQSTKQYQTFLSKWLLAKDLTYSKSNGPKFKNDFFLGFQRFFGECLIFSTKTTLIVRSYLVHIGQTLRLMISLVLWKSDSKSKFWYSYNDFSHFLSCSFYCQLLAQDLDFLLVITSSIYLNFRPSNEAI